MVADDQDLALDAALPRWPVGGEHVGVEVVVPGERDRLWMQWNGLTRGEEVLTKAFHVPVCDEAGGEAEEGFVDVVSPLP
ncbi:hypothetical protein ACWCXC_35220, partial [Streptomyces sp. NPDC001515]